MTHSHLAHLSLTDDDRDELADLLLAIMSSRMFLELVDTMGHQPDRAAQLVTWAVDSLLTRAQADNGMHRRANSSAE